MKQATTQEPMSDSSHSCTPAVIESNHNGNRVKSAAMLGIALSVGASGALVSQAEASAAVTVPNASETTKAFSSESKVSNAQTAESTTTSQHEIVAYHTVASGESLWQIAQQHRIGLQDLKSANELPPETAIRVGQVLRVPASNAVSAASTEIATAEITTESATQLVAGGTIEIEQVTAQPDEPVLLAEASEGIEPVSASIEIEIEDSATLEETEPVVTALAPTETFSSYQIRSGDTLASIASSLGTTPQEIILVNNIANPDVILTGSVLRVPATSSGEAVARGGAAPAEQLPTSRANTSSQRLAYLQSTAVRPDAARMLDELRSASPDSPAIVRGEEVVEQDLVSTESQSAQSAECAER